jgi:hypothetical protein
MWFSLCSSEGESFMDVEFPLKKPETLGKCWGSLAYEFMVSKKPLFVQNGYIEGQEKLLDEDYLVQPDELVLVRLEGLRSC